MKVKRVAAKQVVNLWLTLRICLVGIIRGMDERRCAVESGGEPKRQEAADGLRPGRGVGAVFAPQVQLPHKQWLQAHLHLLAATCRRPTALFHDPMTANAASLSL
jgi:hypothetical protein